MAIPPPHPRVEPLERIFRFSAPGTKTRPGARELEVELCGCTLRNINLISGYPDAPSKASDLGNLMVDLHEALTSPWKVTKQGIAGPDHVSKTLFDGRFNFEKASLITSRHQKTTAWIEALQLYELQARMNALLYTTSHVHGGCIIMPNANNVMMCRFCSGIGMWLWHRDEGRPMCPECHGKL